jgi:hypothetical protein
LPKCKVTITPPVECDAEIQLTFTLREFRALHSAVEGRGTMQGAWGPILLARKELTENGITI